ncbi:hypothetical protein ACFWUQ_19760 [Streptomyces sp. NPDC058662]|uniref:hypothetical protein n=1 Tax=Streptomyces sp. NPDC058662 TaxID=3346583 RepID=UPI00364C7960
MKLRNTAAATLGALALALSFPASALAAEGYFGYKYVDGFGQEQRQALSHPHSGECINLHFVSDDDVRPGYAPHNATDSAAVVYADADCEGPEWRLRAGGNPARDDLKVRSVRFDVNPSE